jgi:hypothetical protein
VVVDRQPQAVHGALAEQLDRPLLAERHQRLRDHQAEVGERDRGQAVELADRDVVGDRDLDQVRLGQLEGDRRERERQPHQQQARVRPQERPQLAHQLDVVRLAEDLLVARRRGARAHAASAVSWVRYSSA